MVKEAACIALNVRNNYLKRSLRAFSIIGSTKEEISPPIEAISRTKVEDKKENLALGVKKHFLNQETLLYSYLLTGIRIQNQIQPLIHG